MKELSIYQKLLNAGELFHYANKFKDDVFLLAFSDFEHFKLLSEDISVLRSAGIRLIIVSDQLNDISAQFERFCYLDSHFNLYQDDSGDLCEFINLTHSEENTPIIISKDLKPLQALAEKYDARKLMFIGVYDPIPQEVLLGAQMTPDHFEDFAEGKPEYASLQKYVEALIDRVQIVNLKPLAGELFQEVFTHLGAGTLMVKG